jgi:hypothetical protein
MQWRLNSLHIFSAFIIGIFSLSSLIIYAQTATPITNTTSSLQKPEIVITYPDVNQTIPTGTLTIYGKSSDNAATHCLVSSLLNEERPYQNATGTGPAGKDDYSKWTFTFDPYYTIINEGLNEIVSRIICFQDDGTNRTAFNSINVTGAQPEDRE